MSRPITLSPEEKKQKKQELRLRQITISPQQHVKDKIIAFSEQYKSVNCAIIDLIKTHPDFKNFKVPASR